MNRYPNLDDLKLFMLIVRERSLAAVARELGVSAAFVTKRLQILEARLGTKLLHRGPRAVVLTEDGGRVYEQGVHILGNVDELLDALSALKGLPRGSLSISCAVGFGPRYLAPALSAFRKRYPQIEIRFDAVDRPVDLHADGIDIDIVQGEHPPEQHVAKRLASNTRIFCASPEYLRNRGTPETLADLSSHSCLVIKSREHAFGVWTVRNGSHYETVRVRDAMSSNNGDVCLTWALDSWGVLLRSQWRVRTALADGSLIHILREYEQPAHVWAVYPARLVGSAKVKACIEFLTDHFQQFATLSSPRRATREQGR